MKLFKKISLPTVKNNSGIMILFILLHLLTQATHPFLHSVILEEKGRVYQFSVIYQEIKIKSNAMVSYSWHRNGHLQATKGDYSGNILHGSFQEFDKSGKMLEKGTFNYGTKDGEWKSWNRNGEIIKLEKWNKGFLKNRIIYEQPKCTVEYFRHNQINKRIVFNAGYKKKVENYREGVLVDKNKKRIKPIFPSKKQKIVTDVDSNK